MTRKYNTIRFLNLRKGHTYRFINYEMILRKVNADRLARGLRPYRLGHKKSTRKPIIHLTA
jgi:hypothetical protein